MNLDWKLLREQKLTLLSIEARGLLMSVDLDNINGMVNLIDTIQDDAVDRGVPPGEVFGEDLD